MVVRRLTWIVGIALTGMSFLPGSGSAVAGTFGEAERVAGVDKTAMAVDREGDRLYVAAGKSLTVFDISEPLKPRRLGSADGVDNRRQLVVRDRFAYLVSRETGLRIFDCTDPTAPRVRSRFDSIEFATGIDVAGKVAFLSERINGVECVDISDPDNPAHISIRKTGESQSNRYRDGYLYSGEWGAAEVTVFDARDMRNFREIARLPLNGFGDGLELDGDFLYCSTGHDARHRADWTGDEAVGRGRGLNIFSISDPAHPKAVGRIDFPRFRPRDDDYWTVRVSDGVAYCADSHNGLFAVDVKDPAKPRVVDRFCVADPRHADWPSAAVSSLAVGEGCLYVTVTPGGLYVVPIEGLKPAARPQGEPPRHPDYRDAYPTDAREFAVYRPAREGQARTATVHGDIVYAAFGDAGLHVLRVTAEGAFEKLGELPNRKVYDCCFCGEKLVTAEGLDGFAVYRLEGTARFREIARRARLGDHQTVAFWTWAPDDRTVVLTGRYGSKSFFPIDDINGASRLNLGSTCQWDKYMADRAIGGMIANLSAYRGLQWVDLKGGKPTLVTTDLNFPAGQTCGVCAFGEKFLATYSSHHSVKGDSRPRTNTAYAFAGPDMKLGPFHDMPEVPGWGPNGTSAGFVGVPRSDGRFVAMNGRSVRRAALYDFADPASPKLVKAWKLAGNPDLCAFCRGRLLIPAGHQGLLLTRETLGQGTDRAP